MTSAELATNTNGAAAIVEAVMIAGDLAKLTPAERVEYYRKTCESLHLNPLTRPFDYINLNGKLTLYALRGATDQLRQVHGISIYRLDRESMGDLYVVTAYVRTPDGREDSDMGAASIAGLKGDALVNAMLKAVTKAKRRATLSICGLGWLDETEIESNRDAKRVRDDGEIETPESERPQYTVTRQYEPPVTTTSVDDAPSQAWARWLTACEDARRSGIGNPWAKAVTPDMDEATINTWAAKLEKRLDG